jgi:iron-sulfur cluster repair protein YtfE (RIC family)
MASATGATAPRPDVSELIAVHGVFRDTLGAAPELVGGVAPGDSERLAQVANYYDNILFFLEAHHDGEEEIVFPALRDRCRDQQALLDRLDAEHKEAIALLATAQGSLAAWAGADSAAGEAVVNDLGALRTQLVTHLDREETDALPLCEENLSAEEWGSLAGHGMANYQGDKIWLILGLIRERMTEVQRARMLEHMPPPAVDMWTSFGERAFQELSDQVPVEVTTRVTD